MSENLPLIALVTLLGSFIGLAVLELFGVIRPR